MSVVKYTALVLNAIYAYIEGEKKMIGGGWITYTLKKLLSLFPNHNTHAANTNGASQTSLKYVRSSLITHCSSIYLIYQGIILTYSTY